MNVKRFSIFAIKVILAHTITYLVIGAVAYFAITRQFYEGASPIFATFMRTQADPDLWASAMTWQIPGQLLRGFLIAAALYPFFDTLASWNFRKRFCAIAGLYIILGFWASASPMPGTIEGMIYLRPQFTPYVHLMVQPEIIAQGVALGAWVAWWMVPRARVVIAKKQAST
jgi:hypothetical protein